jgi:8-oxo-dGTP pyrophosphatase MutT (NUDIX family)
VLLFAPDGALLLIRFVAEREGAPFVFWVTPGGEVESGEDDRTAAERELLEELGIRPVLAGPVHQESGGTYTHLGETVRNFDVFFAAMCERDAPTLQGITPDEIRLMQEIRWWTPEDLGAAEEPVFPATLAALAVSVFRSLKAA